MVWKSDGDDVRRKYDFRYDGANRLLRADFTQQNPGDGQWNANRLNFSVRIGNGQEAVTAYDAAGNLQKMVQHGWTLSGATVLDNLTYTYYPQSNKLRAVQDSGLGSLSRSYGDFADRHTGVEDYGYDANGNLVTDRNRKLDGTTGLGLTSGGAIGYNHLNLPQQITMQREDGSGVRGTIGYTYDATGLKLRKTVQESGRSPQQTLYLNEAVYQNDTLQFIGHEEGRLRIEQRSTGSVLVSDYFLKDHLGNVRMVLTDQSQQDIYPVASLETGTRSCEQAYYQIEENRSVDASVVNGLPAYSSDNGLNGMRNVCGAGGTSQQLYRLIGSSSGGQSGLGMTLKVMAGDRLDIFGKSYYPVASSGSGSAVPVQALFAGLLGGSGAAGLSDKGATASGLLQDAGLVSAVTNGFLQHPDRGVEGAQPRAYVNWILFDEQLQYVTGGFSKVHSQPGTLKEHVQELQNIVLNKSGYVYIYVSNESPVAVFFDNLQVVHTRGPPAGGNALLSVWVGDGGD
jgi:hypothetical protein